MQKTTNLWKACASSAAANLAGMSDTQIQLNASRLMSLLSTIWIQAKQKGFQDEEEEHLSESPAMAKTTPNFLNTTV